MSVFNEEDTKTMKLIGLATGGFAALTVALILLANFVV